MYSRAIKPIKVRNLPANPLLCVTEQRQGRIPGM